MSESTLLHDLSGRSSEGQFQSHKKKGQGGTYKVFVFVFIIAVVGLAMWAASRWDRWIGERGSQSTDDAYVASDVRPLSSHVAGYVRSVLVNDFQKVKAGQTIAKIVDDDYVARATSARANLAAARASLQQLQDQIDVQEANVRAAEAASAVTTAALQRDRIEAYRQHTLLDKGLAGTRQKVEVADAKLQQDEATLTSDKAKISAQAGQVKTLRDELMKQQAVIASAEAAVELAKIDLGYTTIVAPADGMIGRRLVQHGQYVNVGTQITSFVPLPHVWVIANYREIQMTRVRRGQTATVSVDAFPDAILRGHVEGWSPASGAVFALLPPDNATGNFTKVVQRIPVKIVLDGQSGIDDLLRPGMSVTATIDTSSGG